MQRKGKSENFDPQVASSNSYNDVAGAQKNLQVGPKLKPIKLAEDSYTTAANVARQLPKGTQLAIYNNSTIASITFGKDSTVTSLAAGVCDTAGHVGVALKANDWTFICLGEDSWFITSAATALVYVIEDHTVLK